MRISDWSSDVCSSDLGNLRRQESQEAMIGNILVQELMIMANTQAGLYMLSQHIPGIFRKHERQASAPDSGELAKTIQICLNSHALDGVYVQSDFSPGAGKGRYGFKVTGLHGLKSPV